MPVQPCVIRCASASNWPALKPKGRFIGEGLERNKTRRLWNSPRARSMFKPDANSPGRLCCLKPVRTELAARLQQLLHVADKLQPSIARPLAMCSETRPLTQWTAGSLAQLVPALRLRVCRVPNTSRSPGVCKMPRSDGRCGIFFKVVIHTPGAPRPDRAARFP